MTQTARVAALLAREGEDMQLFVWVEDATLDTYHDPEYVDDPPTPTTIRAALSQLREPRYVPGPEGQQVLVREQLYIADGDEPTLVPGVRLPEVTTADGRELTVVQVSGAYMGGRYLDVVEHLVQA